MNRSTTIAHHRLPHAVRVLKALAHPVRLRVLAMLATGELCVCQMTAVLELAASTVSGHLADLRAAGLVIERKEGKWVHYRLAEDPAMEAVVQSALALLTADSQTGEDSSVVRYVRQMPLEAVSGGGVDLAALARRGRTGCSARSARRTGSSRVAPG